METKDSKGVEHKLMAILMADVVGYSRLMGQDHDATVQALTQSRNIFASQIENQKGRVVNAPGDSILAEFPSVVDAVACAVAIQRALAERNAQSPEDRRMHFRIGVNLGDVIVKDGELYGDGVNIASRLESLAEPGEVNISGTAYDQLQNRLPLEYESLGEKSVKNIDHPVRVYRVLSKPGAAAHRVVKASRFAAKLGERKGTLIGLAASAVVVGLLVTGGVYFTRPPAGDSSLTVRGIPTIAVLPFENLSDDPKQEFFVDGMTEELITLLAQFRDLSVIASNSMFTYKDKSVDVRAVGKEMGADFVLEGSVRRSSDRLRLTAQLLSAKDGKHLWAETFDRDLTAAQVFALQDDLAERVATAVAGAYGAISLSRFRDTTRKPPDQLQSYDCVLRVFVYTRVQSAESHHTAKECLERVITVDPHYADAWAWLSFIYLEDYALGFNTVPSPFERAQETLQRANALDPSNPVATFAGANYLYFKRDPRFFDQAREAVSANPRDSFTLALLGQNVVWAGEPAEGLAMVERAIELDPVVPGYFFLPFSTNAFFEGDYLEGLAYAKKVNMPGFHWYHFQLALQYVGLGELDKAREQAELMRQSFPNFEIHAYEQIRMWIWNMDEVEAMIAALRKAGMEIPDEV